MTELICGGQLETITISGNKKFLMIKPAIYILLLTLLSLNVFAQPPIQKFWALNQPHYIYMNGATGWQINNNNDNVSISGQTLTLTNNNNTQAGSAYYMLKMGMRRDFTASFIYTSSGGDGGTLADGTAFVIQNNGTTALGATGEGLGYQGIGNNNIAVCFNLYPSYTIGVKYVTNGVDPSTGGYTSASPITLSGSSVNVTISYSYSAKTLTVKLVQGANTKTFTYNGMDIPAILGSPLGWVGFSGATGGSRSTQTVTNFIFK